MIQRDLQPILEKWMNEKEEIVPNNRAIEQIHLLLHQKFYFDGRLEETAKA